VEDQVVVALVIYKISYSWIMLVNSIRDSSEGGVRSLSTMVSSTHSYTNSGEVMMISLRRFII
jgi:hypothetical protein